MSISCTSKNTQALAHPQPLHACVIIHTLTRIRNRYAHAGTRGNKPTHSHPKPLHALSERNWFPSKSESHKVPLHDALKLLFLHGPGVITARYFTKTCSYSLFSQGFGERVPSAAMARRWRILTSTSSTTDMPQRTFVLRLAILAYEFSPRDACDIFTLHLLRL